MKLFIITRWGNPFEEDGPDGKDTNFLVRALTLEEASEMTDQRLKTMTNKVSGNRPVKCFSQFAAEIGVDNCSEKRGIVHGPWIESILVNDLEQYPSWHRDDADGEWNKS